MRFYICFPKCERNDEIHQKYTFYEPNVHLFMYTAESLTVMCMCVDVVPYPFYHT